MDLTFFEIFIKLQAEDQITYNPTIIFTISIMNVDTYFLWMFPFSITQLRFDKFRKRHEICFKVEIGIWTWLWEIVAWADESRLYITWTLPKKLSTRKFKSINARWNHDLQYIYNVSIFTMIYFQGILVQVQCKVHWWQLDMSAAYFPSKDVFCWRIDLQTGIIRPIYMTDAIHRMTEITKEMIEIINNGA